jgi:UDP-glucose 4-epimerase
MNILITGGAGFIGSHIADAYLAAGHRVVIVDNLSTGRRDLVPKGAVFHETDIGSNQCAEILRNEEIHIINHHAAQISVQESVKNPVKDAKSNILGTLQLIENALSSGVGKFIFASTGGALYGDETPPPVSEDRNPNPLSPYAISKLSVEHYLNFYAQVHGLSSVVLRYSNVYGPRQNPLGEAGVVAIHCHRLNQGMSPVIFGDGKQTRDFISIRDVVPANLIALQPEFRGTYNVGTGKETSVNHLTEVLLSLSGKQLEIDRQPAKSGEQRRSALDPRKIQSACGWQPKVSLEEGLLETLNYFTS